MSRVRPGRLWCCRPWAQWRIPPESQEHNDVRREDFGRAGRRPHRRDQPVAGRRGARGARASSMSSAVYGARHGVRGIVNEDFVDLTQETSHNLELVAATPSSALGSTRDKPDLKYCQRDLQGAAGARASGTSSTSAATTRPTPCASSARRRQRPATRCAASTSPRRSTTTWSSTTTRRASPRPRASSRRRSPAPTSTTRALPGVYVAVVMGRHAGFLTAASALAQKFADDGPHLIYLPERAFVLEQLPRRREGRARRATAAA